MSVEKMKELADQNGYDELYNDARTSSDRYVYKLLFGEERIYDKLSPDAKVVLDKATELVERSMELRQVMANDENHLNSWDAGYAQLKLVWKEYFQEEFKEFRQLYKNLEDRMRPLVYELGFLKK
jgi:TRAP-type mannitol/chloroaromatic compound transport system substrate-binding protein